MIRPAQRTAAPQRRGWSDKRDAILAAGLRVFGRDGYTRGSIDSIATEANVSSRTIYNHFGDKEALFRSVIERSATQVADEQTQVIAHHLDAVDDLELDLIAFCLAWATPTPEFAEHFALVRQINAEVPHIPAATLNSWQVAGPLRVRRELAVRMRHLAERGLIHAPDPDLAASHLILLTATEVANRAHFAAEPPSAAEVTRLVTAGVHTFLHGHKRNT
ncbi:MAG: TetR/AcrR family transcriptional regulator [Jatrophihabitans sp.]